jgi:hypothetical protein
MCPIVIGAIEHIMGLWAIGNIRLHLDQCPFNKIC